MIDQRSHTNAEENKAIGYRISVPQRIRARDRALSLYFYRSVDYPGYYEAKVPKGIPLETIPKRFNTAIVATFTIRQDCVRFHTTAVNLLLGLPALNMTPINEAMESQQTPLNNQTFNTQNANSVETDELINLNDIKVAKDISQNKLITLDDILLNESEMNFNISNIVQNIDMTNNNFALSKDEEKTLINLGIFSPPKEIHSFTNNIQTTASEDTFQIENSLNFPNIRITVPPSHTLQSMDLMFVKRKSYYYALFSRDEVTKKVIYELRKHLKYFFEESNDEIRFPYHRYGELLDVSVLNPRIETRPITCRRI